MKNKTILHAALVIVGTACLVLGNNPNIVDDFMTKKRIAYVDIKGVISDRKQTNYLDIVEALEEAFKDKKSPIVVMNINSPGGSPVQSDLIYREAKALKRKYNKPLYAVVEDVCASGGYYIAVAADKIYAQPSSIIGSIGVISTSFGFVDVMKRHGVERRKYTAGSGKGMLDPYSKIDKKDEAHFRSILRHVHEEFIFTVKVERSKEMKGFDYSSAYVWTGYQAKELGLIDEIGSLTELSRQTIGDVKLKNYTKKKGIIDRITGSFKSQIEDALIESSSIINLN